MEIEKTEEIKRVVTSRRIGASSISRWFTSREIFLVRGQ